MNHLENGSSRRVLAPGTVIAGKYRVERMLAEGGMGLVVAATHLHLDQCVALKFLRGDVGSEWQALTRFTREAKAAAQLRSEHVAHVLDAGLTEDGTPYMAMEFLEGHSLARELQLRGALDVASAVEYVIQACEGLAEAHARGIVHRDVKPYNLFLVERAPGWHAIKILDFGISKFAFSDAPNVVTGVIIGSPCYMSPEQLRSTATVDHRTDIWSLGATLHELLAGRAAFDASQTLPELVAAILDKPAAPLHELRASVPRELSAVVARCLSKDREARFASTGEVAMALLPFAPPRSRVLAERAASMKPAFRVPEVESEIASGMPVPAWNGFASNPALPPASPDDESEQPASTAPEHALQHTTDAPTTMDTGAPDTDEPVESEGAAAMARSRAFRWLGVGTLAAAALVVFVTILVAAPEPSGRSAATKVVQSVAVPAVTRPEVLASAETLSPLPPTSASSELLELSVRATPASARITIDGTAMAENPFQAAYPRDGAKHHVTVRADGYETKSQDVSLTKDTVIDINLTQQRAPVRASATPTSASAPRAARRPSVSTPPVVASPNTPPPQPPATTTGEVDSSGGRLPLRPIETHDPYGPQ